MTDPTFRAFLTERHGSTADTLLDTRAPAPSYKDILARNERRRADGSPVWPLTDADLPSRAIAA